MELIKLTPDNHDEIAKRLGISQGEWKLNLGNGISIGIDKDSAGLSIVVAKITPNNHVTIIHHKFIPQSELKVEPIGYFEGRPIYSQDELSPEEKNYIEKHLGIKI